MAIYSIWKDLACILAQMQKKKTTRLICVLFHSCSAGVISDYALYMYTLLYYVNTSVNKLDESLSRIKLFKVIIQWQQF